MEFLIELLFDIIVEGSIAIGSEKTVPMPLRIIAVIISLIVFEYYDAMKSQFRQTGNHLTETGKSSIVYASLLA